MECSGLISYIRCSIKMKKNVVLSIVSHNQGDFIRDLLADVDAKDFGLKYEVIVVVTINLPEDESFLGGHRNLNIKIIRNVIEKGFGHNHNSAFLELDSDIFVVVNPDIRIERFDLDSFLSYLDASVGVIGPLVVSPKGNVEDSFRTFPTIRNVAYRKIFNDRNPSYRLRSSAPINVDWLAGMFLAFNSIVYRELGGFDEKYFMYLEDADICRRSWLLDKRVVLVPCHSVVHDARRATGKSFRHFRWHLTSLIRFVFNV